MNTRTPIRLTPLIATAQQMRAQFIEQDGWRVPEIFSGMPQEIAAARERVALADESPRGKLYVEGREAATVVRAATQGDLAYRLRDDLYFVSTAPGKEADLFQVLQATARAAGKFITITDMTHGLAEIRVVGPASRALGHKLCGLDFDDARFPNHAAKQTSVAKTRQLIIRRDIGNLPAFSIIGACSLAAYLWDALMRAGREWDIAPMGRAAVKCLEEGISP